MRVKIKNDIHVVRQDAIIFSEVNIKSLSTTFNQLHFYKEIFLITQYDLIIH